MGLFSSRAAQDPRIGIPGESRPIHVNIASTPNITETKVLSSIGKFRTTTLPNRFVKANFSEAFLYMSVPLVHRVFEVDETVLAHSGGNHSASFARPFLFHNFGRFVWLMAPKSYVLSSEMVWSSRKHALRVMPMAVSNAAFKERLSEGSQLHPCEIASQTIVWDRPQISVHSVCSSNWQHAFRCSSETNPRQIPENSVGIRGSVVILARLAIMGS